MSINLGLDKKVKVKLFKLKLHPHEANFSAWRLGLFVIVFSCIGAYSIFRSFAATPMVGNIEAESMVLPAGSSVVSDSTASAGKAVKMSQSSSALNGSVGLATPASSFSVAAHGIKCRGGWPTLTILIDNNPALTNKTVNNTNWQTFSVTMPLTGTTHALSVVDSSANSCRTLYIDNLAFFGASSVTPAPTVSFSASPASIIAGNTSTLTWSTTNATSCTASGAWSGTQALSGSVSTGVLNASTTYGLACTGTGGSVSASVTVTVSTGSSTSSACPNLAAGECTPYDPTGPWNTLIGSNPTISSLSATYMNAISNNGLPLTSDPTQYTIPVYLVNSSTPTYTVTGQGYFHSYDAGNDTTSVGHGSPWSISGVSIPAGATSGAGSDGQIIFWNPTTGVKYEFWQFAKDASGNYYASNGNREHTTTGYYGRFGDALAGRGAGTSYFAGMVRPWEIAQGHIYHALAFAYATPSSAFVYPASKSDGGNFGGVLGTDLPEGSRLQLNPSLTDADFTSWGLSPAAKVIAHALQDYGMYTIDHSGSSKIYLEDSSTAKWDSSITRDLVKAIPWSQFRVLAPTTGPL